MKTQIYYILGFGTLIMLILYIKLWSKTKKKVLVFIKRIFSSDSRRARGALKSFESSLKEHMDSIEVLYESFVGSEDKYLELPNSIEWVFDNYYIIVEKEKTIIDRSFSSMFFSLLRHQYTHSESKIRVYTIAQDIVSIHEGRINDSIIMNYLLKYQKHTILSEKEIDILPRMILIALIENIAIHSESLFDIFKQWERVNRLVKKRVDDDRIIDETLSKMLDENTIPNTYFVTRLYDVLRENGELNDVTYDLILGLFGKIGKDIDEIIAHSNTKEIQIGLVMGNLITSLKEDSFIDWPLIQKECSVVFDVLVQDPVGIYAHMSLETQVLYRDKIVKLSEKSKISEVKIANAALKLADSSDDLDAKKCHVGYYLIDEGEVDLRRTLGMHDHDTSWDTSLDLKKRVRMYLSLLTIVSIFLLFVTLNPLSLVKPFNVILSLIFMIIPISEIALIITNHLSILQTHPQIFPSLSLKEGIEKDMTTLIIIPALLPNLTASEKIVRQLEKHYLLNRDENLFFAIVGAFKDADKEHLDTDQEVLDFVIDEIQKLNATYGEKFYLLQRKRVYNESNNQWIGWERKRGAITQLNEFLLNNRNTSFIYPLELPGNLSDIKYVITLDSDTILPIQAAKKMIAILEHPLNKPVIDKELNIVTEGYGVLQPNILTDVKSASASLFSRVFNVQLGFSPYSRRSSNLYQDFFKQGIFMGKGIYNLKVFNQVLGHTFPENRILSHDLLEGSYLRTAFTSDLSLIDNYPQTYILHASRQYRWIRGDWQLLPYLGKHVMNSYDTKKVNPLSTLSKWQILDNLRRSLLSPSLMVLIFLSTAGLFDNNQAIILFVIFVSFIETFEALLYLPIHIIRNPQGIKDLLKNLIQDFSQNLMIFVFLPFEAWRMIRGIFITLIRLGITKQNLLQWTTSSAMGTAFKNTVSRHFLEMMASLVQIGFLVYLYQLREPYSIYLFITMILLWTSTPIFAYVTGLNLVAPKEEVPLKHREELGKIARKTYLYFETFSNKTNNYIVPDNYQESPLKSVDARTSPTNIGFGLCADLTAFDFGYLELDAMFSAVSSTLKTIEKLPKWQGHLYNWYNTKTLEPLNPIYISTVDSGNFVGYLIVVREGLKESLDHVLSYSKFIQGLKDTLACINTSQIMDLVEIVNGLEDDSDIETIMFKVHPKFVHYFESCSIVDPWLERFKKQVYANISAYRMFYPYMEHLREIPQILKDDAQVGAIIISLNTWQGLKETIDVYSHGAHLVESQISEREFNVNELVWLKKLSLILLEASEILTLKYHSYIDMLPLK